MSLLGIALSPPNNPSPGQPWDKRKIVQLPGSGHLGLENFTVHPETPPVSFHPVPVPSEPHQALWVDGGADNMDDYPFIAAITWPPGGLRTGMQILNLGDPTNKTMEQNPFNCPAGFICTADTWDVKQEAEGRGFSTKLRYAGYPGGWVAVKDESPHGWSVYWDAKAAGDGQPADGTKIDLVFDAVRVGGGYGPGRG